MGVAWDRSLVAKLRCRTRAREAATAQAVGGVSQWPTTDGRHFEPERARLLMAVAEYLRQPLYALNLASEGLLLHPEQVPGSTALPHMRASLSYLDNRIDALELVASLDSGVFVPNMVDFSIQPLLDHLDAAFRPLASERGLRWDVTPTLARVRSNPLLLERMVANLVDNAMRFTVAGGVVVSSRLRGRSLLLQVWDTGLGIDAQYHARIFDAFFRDAPDGDRGTGLGLPIVKSGARAMGIGVALRSVPGRGSCFSMRVPLASDAETGQGDAANLPSAA